MGSGRVRYPNLDWSGYLTEIESYSKAKAIVLVQKGYPILARYGALVEITDAEDPSVRYLAMVINVREKGLLPSIDHAKLQSLLEALVKQQTPHVPIDNIVRELVFPGASRQFGLREADLEILGEIVSRGDIFSLEFHRRPPRPYSTVREAGKSTLESLLYKKSDLMVLGKHMVHSEIFVPLDPENLVTHLAVVGQTGSGKTETVKRIVLEYIAKTRPDNTLLLFDIAGEYLGYPYSKPGVVSLLKAILKPQTYACPNPRGNNQSLITPKRIDITIPYAIEKIGFRRDSEMAYFSRYLNIYNYLNEKGLNVESLLVGRHGFYTIQSTHPSEVKSISTKDAVEKVNSSNNLLLALPLQDALTIDKIMNLSGSKSEYAPVIISEAAASLDLLAGDTVVGIHTLHLIIKIIN